MGIDAVIALENGWQFVVPGYLITFGLIAAYAVWVVQRGRRLSAELPEEERRFLG